LHNKNCIYTVTTIRHALAAGNRSVGFFHTFEEAEQVLKENIMDINECGYYKYAVIEIVPPGIYTYPREELWYKWNHEKDSYEPCPKPERFQQVVGWSLG
jgi:hypothetical protein